MMPVEPGVLDANILVYAFDVDAPQHAASRALLNAAPNPANNPACTLGLARLPRYPHPTVPRTRRHWMDGTAGAPSGYGRSRFRFTDRGDHESQ